MLQLAQRTCAPSAVSVSMSTAVWTVMCSEPVMRAPFSGCAAPNSSRSAIRPGISCSASLISLRPNSARERSATLKSSVVVVVVVAMSVALLGIARSSGGQEPLMLLLLPAQPVVCLHVLRTLGLGLEPRLHRVAELPLAAQAQREADLAQAHVVVAEQLAQGAQ